VVVDDFSHQGHAGGRAFKTKDARSRVEQDGRVRVLKGDLGSSVRVAHDLDCSEKIGSCEKKND